jgi:dCTP deaminase
MPFWSGETLNEWIPRFNIIDPFDAAQIDCAAYTLRMGREAYITPDYQVSVLSRHRKEIIEEHGHIIIPAGQFAFLLTEEVISVPNHVVGFISLKAGIKFRGLINVSGFHVDPGFRGHLVYAVYNAGPSSIHLARGMSLFLIWFANLDRTDSRYVRKANTLIENERINPLLIESIPGEILSTQSLSKRLEDLERQLFSIKAYGVAAFAIIGLVFAALKLDWKSFLGP